MHTDDLTIEHNAKAGRFSTRVDGFLAFLDYQRKPGRILIPHVEVPEPFRGRGIATRLTIAGLEYARREHLAVVPLCPFVATFIERHPEYQALVDPR